MTTTVWFCEKHYNELCEKAGYEVPVLAIYNIFRDKCANLDCDEDADHLIERTNDPDFAVRCDGGAEG
jgi:hypothetical protein